VAAGLESAVPAAVETRTLVVQSLKYSVRKAAAACVETLTLLGVALAEPCREAPRQAVQRDAWVASTRFPHELPFVSPITVEVGSSVLVRELRTFRGAAVTADLDLEDVHRRTPLRLEQEIQYLVALLRWVREQELRCCTATAQRAHTVKRTR
jgi:hypothetical protein